MHVTLQHSTGFQTFLNSDKFEMLLAGKGSRVIIRTRQMQYGLIFFFDTVENIVRNKIMVDVHDILFHFCFVQMNSIGPSRSSCFVHRFVVAQSKYAFNNHSQENSVFFSMNL